MSAVIRSAVALFILTFQISAWAIDYTTPSDTHNLSSYFGVGYDALNFKTNKSGILAQYPTLSANTTIESSSPNLSLVGGMNLDEHLAIQFDMVFFGSIRAKDSGVSKQLFSPTMISISAIMSQPVSDKLSVFGKFGGNYWGLNEPNNAEDTINDGFGLIYGAGIDFNLYGGKDRMLRLEWTHYQMDGVFLDSADGITLGALFKMP